MIENRFDRAELADERARRLLADAGHARDVVDRVAHEPEHIGHECRIDPEALSHLGHPATALAHRIEPDRALVHELHQVLVSGHEHGLDGGAACLPGERADHVVRLDSRHLEGRQPERLDHLADVAELGPELVRHGRAVRLVAGEEPVAEGLAGCVEDDHDVLRALLAE